MATVFVGGSALLLAGAMAALAFGFANGEETLVWTALVSSGIAALFLVIAYVISLRDMRAARSSTPAVEVGTVAPPQAAEQTQAEPPTQADTDESPEAKAEGETAAKAEAETPAPAALSTGSPTATKPSTSKKSSAPGTAAAARPSSPSDAVVAVASRKKFHRPECRYAKSDSAEGTTRATARKRGFSPCGICKP
jgi:hypothetical protein